MPADLFSASPQEHPTEPVAGSRPLADRLRPTRLQDVVGQPHLTGPGGPLARAAKGGVLPSTILWGPPGVGKTTIARLLAAETDRAMVGLSAIGSGVAELRKAFESAAVLRRDDRAAILFVDEIHRFNRAQQDSFLPHVEAGAFVLLGATTENPSFALNDALLSRAQVLTLNPLDGDALAVLLERAESELGRPPPLTVEARRALIARADGDGRALLSMVEQVYDISPDTPLEPESLAQFLSNRSLRYDRSGDEHYGLISALHKSVRGSDPDAALYWFARMLEAGEEPLYIARRLVRMAVEDIGLADPEALKLAIAARDAFEFLGSPEGELSLAECVLYLSCAPKSNSTYVAYKAARSAARRYGSLHPPKHILNAPNKFMKSHGFGDGYEYDHDDLDGVSGQTYFPTEMVGERFFAPVERGYERELLKRLAFFARKRAQRSGGGPSEG